MNIRRAEARDISRIAEILVFVKRMNYRPIFNDDAFSFVKLQVLSVAEEYSAPDVLGQIWVYDDGIVKGMLRMEGEEIRELYVDHFFQGEGIGGALMEFAKGEFGAQYLWALEKNVRAIRFYEAHGFFRTGEKTLNPGTDQYIILLARKKASE